MEDDERIGVSPYALYQELQALRLQSEALQLQSQTLCERLDRVLAVLEPVLCAKTNETSDAPVQQQQQQQPGPTYVASESADVAVVHAVTGAVCDVDQVLRNHILLVLRQTERALTNSEIIAALHGAIEQRYEQLSKKQVNAVLHAMLKSGALFCESRGKYNYWTTPHDTAQQQRS